MYITACVCVHSAHQVKTGHWIPQLQTVVNHHVTAGNQGWRRMASLPSTDDTMQTYTLVSPLPRKSNSHTQIVNFTASQISISVCLLLVSTKPRASTGQARAPLSCTHSPRSQVLTTEPLTGWGADTVSILTWTVAFGPRFNSNLKGWFRFSLESRATNKLQTGICAGATRLPHCTAEP